MTLGRMRVMIICGVSLLGNGILTSSMSGTTTLMTIYAQNYGMEI